MDFHPAEYTNLAECIDLFIDVFNSPPWNEHWEIATATQRLEACYHTPGFDGVIGKIGGKPIGFALGYVEQWDRSKHFYLKEMCVTPKWQRHGTGTALLHELEEMLKRKGVEKIYLYTARETVAQIFYEKQGFYVSAKMIMMAKWLTEKPNTAN
ncbi:MAG: GNAT family N-acetyltransferase [Caldilinea sp. CFX5]|nr:GNAT family N-acetyltransferase [Caldilinea sp. CFX5]